MDAPIPNETEVRDRSPSETPDLTGDLGGKIGIRFGELITCEICSVDMDAPIPSDTEVRDRSPSETPDLTVGLGGKTEIPLSGFGKPITDRSEKHRTSRVASVARLECPCLGLLDR